MRLKKKLPNALRKTPAASAKSVSQSSGIPDAIMKLDDIVLFSSMMNLDESADSFLENVVTKPKLLSNAIVKGKSILNSML